MARPVRVQWLRCEPSPGVVADPTAARLEQIRARLDAQNVWWSCDSDASVVQYVQQCSEVTSGFVANVARLADGMSMEGKARCKELLRSLEGQASNYSRIAEAFTKKQEYNALMERIWKTERENEETIRAQQGATRDALRAEIRQWQKEVNTSTETLRERYASENRSLKEDIRKLEGELDEWKSMSAAEVQRVEVEAELVQAAIVSLDEKWTALLSAVQRVGKSVGEIELVSPPQSDDPLKCASRISQVVTALEQFLAQLVPRAEQLRNANAAKIVQIQAESAEACAAERRSGEEAAQQLKAEMQQAARELEETLKAKMKKLEESFRAARHADIRELWRRNNYLVRVKEACEEYFSQGTGPLQTLDELREANRELNKMVLGCKNEMKSRLKVPQVADLEWTDDNMSLTLPEVFARASGNASVGGASLLGSGLYLPAANFRRAAT